MKWILVVLVFFTFFQSRVNAQTFEDGAMALSQREYSKAEQIFLRLAMRGDRRATTMLGLMYGRGDGVPRDFRQSATWFRLAANDGMPMAQHYLGLYYLRGDGVEQNDAEAAKFFKMAAVQEYDESQLLLGLLYSVGKGVKLNALRSYMWFNLGASLGNKDASAERDKAETWMTKDQISQGQLMARNCRVSKYRDCGLSD